MKKKQIYHQINEKNYKGEIGFLFKWIDCHLEYTFIKYLRGFYKQ